MIRTTLALAAAGLLLTACDAKPDAAKPGAAAANSEAALKARAEAAAARSAAATTAGSEIATPELKAFVETYEKITGIILTVKDQASAKDAVEQLRPLIQQMQTQAQAINALPGPEINAAAKQANSRLITSRPPRSMHVPDTT